MIDFICPDCVAVEVRNWLPTGFVERFDRFHGVLRFYFEAFSTEKNDCTSCKGAVELSLCPKCYVSHVEGWIGSTDKQLATKFDKLMFTGELKPNGATHSGEAEV